MGGRVAGRAAALIGPLAAAFVLAIGLVPVASLLFMAGGDAGSGLLGARTLAVLRFTLVQAALSALLAVLPAILVARALSRRAFPGRDLVERLLALPVLVPALVAASAILSVYGRSGVLAGAARGLGLDWPGIYGLTGILIGHVFLNLPLAVRILGPAFAAVPPEQWRLARQLGLGDLARFRLLEWPALRPRVARALGLVFMLCFTSFALPMTLGGGPRTNTLEVAIYEALRIDVDLPRVAGLAILQIVTCGALVALGLGVGVVRTGLGTGRPPLIRIDDGKLAKALDGLWLLLAGLFLLAPLAALLIDAAQGPWAKVLTGPTFLAALRNSLVVALAASALAMTLGLCLVMGGRAGPWLARLGDLVGSIPLVIPPLAFGAGLFLLLRLVVDPSAVALPVVALVNAFTGLPYVVGILGPERVRRDQEHDRLCRALGIQGWNRLRLVDLPTMGRAVGLACGLVAAFSLGDFGVVALFGSDEARTLPLHLQLQAGSYRSNEASVTALVLVVLAAGTMLVVERGLARAVRR